MTAAVFALVGSMVGVLGQCHLANFDQAAMPGLCRLTSVIVGALSWRVPLSGRFLDAVGVVPGALEHARVGPVAASGVEVPLAGDVGHDGGAGLFRWFRGERPG
jgi:hypothetical protein